MLLHLFLVLLASSLVKSSAINAVLTDAKAKGVSLTSCDTKDCEAICQLFGYKHGFCKDGECICAKNERPQLRTEKVRSEDYCDDSTCNAMCTIGGSIGGICAGDFCFCYTSKPWKEHRTEVVSVQKDCDDWVCSLMCSGCGFIGGLCVEDACSCYDIKPLKELKDKASYSLTDSCNYQACDQLCRNLGFPGGACVGDRCDCDNFKPLQEFLNLITPKKSIEHEKREKLNNFIKDNVKPKKIVECNIEACNDFCQQSNYIGGVCIGSSCNCY